MLARASSDAGTRLRRSKSASSAHRLGPHVVEPFDPDVAQQHALAAATAAFSRQTAQDAADRKMNRSSEVTKTKSNASRKSLSSQGSHFPPRGSSFRSQNPAQTGQTGSTQSSFRRPTIGTDQKLPHFPSMVNETPPMRPLSAHVSNNLGDNARPTTQPKPGRQTAASSITSLQIRKARSMYYASSIQTGSPIARPPAKYLAAPVAVSASPKLSATTTSSQTQHTGPSPLSGHRIPVTIEPNETVEKARDEYLQAFQQRSVKHKPSLFMVPFRKRQNNTKEKGSRITSVPVSMSSGCDQTSAESVADVTLNDFQPQTDKLEKRSFSGSLKSRIRRVFKRNSNRVPDLPVQQIEASRDYFGTSRASSSYVDRRGYEIPSPDDDVLQRVRSRVPSAEEDPSTSVQAGSSHSGSDSIRSPYCQSSLSQTSASASRVTSWGTTCTGDTLTQRAIKRLTVIHEAKDSIGSETDRLASLSAQRESLPPTFTAFRDPMPMDSVAGEASTPPINPKRIFSALMREIDASKSAKAQTYTLDRTPEADSSLFGSCGMRELHSGDKELHSSASKGPRLSMSSDQRPLSSRPTSAAAQRVPGKKSSIRSFGRAIRSTIRTVTPGERRSSPCPLPLTTEHRTACDPQNDTYTPRSDTTFESQEVADEPLTVIFHGNETGSEEVTRSNNTYTPSAEDIEIRVNKTKDRWKTALEDNNKLQFPRETDRTHVDANSIQRKALPDSQGLDVHQSQSSPESPLSRTIVSPLSPSVYSRNTDGFSILPNDSVVTLNNSNHGDHPHDGGSAIILNSQSVRSYVIGTPSPNRSRSTRTSRDWKAWLSHEISGIETPSQENLSISNRYVTPSRNEQRSSHMSTPRAACEILMESGGGRQFSQMTLKEQLNGLEGLSPTPHSITESVERRSSTLEGVVVQIDIPPADAEQGRLTPRNNSRLLQQKETIVSTPLAAAQTSIETPPSARMNDRFPFINAGRRSSSYTSKFSGHSRSPHDSASSSLKAPKMTPSPKVYTDLSGLTTDATLQQVPDKSKKASEIQQTSKENITPTMRGASRPKISSLGRVPRPKSLQALSPAALNRSPVKSIPKPDGTAGMELGKYSSSPGNTTVHRTRVRANLRPVSPEKLARRPKSAFDLRSTKVQSPDSPGDSVSTTEPVHDLHRAKVYPIKSPSQQYSSPRMISGMKETNHNAAFGEEQRSGSVTPGQRMAEDFLRERKSAAVLERGMRKSGTYLVREDTPAFL